MKDLKIIILGIMGLFLISQTPLQKNPGFKSFIKVEEGKIKGGIYLFGSSKLTNGYAEIKFNEDLSKMVDDISDVIVIVTPRGSWSGIYVEKLDTKGFIVKSGAGDPNAKFDWIIVSRIKSKRRID